MKVTRSQLKRIIAEAVGLSDTYQSHTYEPQIGDAVVNVNQKCKHVGSEGIVVSINELLGDTGKTAEYRCTNSGGTWSIDDILEKTLDQLAPALSGFSR